MFYSVVLLCAGSGSRTDLKYNKMFYKIKDKTVYETVLDNFINDDDCKQIVVVCKENEQDSFLKLVKNKKIEFCLGGKERQDSVYNGLTKVNQEYVFIHDGARPYLSMKSINDLKDCLLTHDACLLMVPAVDTIKVVIDNIVVNTPKRETLMNAQTPQAFKTILIKDAYNQASKNNVTFSDDASLVEMLLDEEVHVVLGEYSNKKITTKEDL